ncbi:hypothetical protein D6779_10750 [Candidatus Parcubacteria bacterium]|nr:MAG: hypothetical protein D6779_10750 [Candidatus Parcubacteria bacterium]
MVAGMLQAVIHGKNWGCQEVEDYITSCFFGTMQYLPPHCVGKVLRWIFFRDDEECADICKVRPECEVHFEFWPKIENEDGSLIEPDLLIYNGGSLLMHVEVKWSSGESSGGNKHQIVSQREAIKAKHGKFPSFYLVLDENKARKELGDCSLVKDGSIRVITWPEVGRRLRDWKLPSGASGAKLWREHAVQYLDELTGLVFLGFNEGLFDGVSGKPWELQSRSPIFLFRADRV